MGNVSFKASKEESELITKIVKRAYSLGITKDSLSTNMDLTAANANGCPLDFQKLLDFDDFSFVHDVSGITCHIDRESGKLGDCFLPRCAKPERAKARAV
jgi:hypothetical protein